MPRLEFRNASRIGLLLLIPQLGFLLTTDVKTAVLLSCTSFLAAGMGILIIGDWRHELWVVLLVVLATQSSVWGFAGIASSMAVAKKRPNVAPQMRHGSAMMQSGNESDGPGGNNTLSIVLAAHGEHAYIERTIESI
eukprot:952623-Rhodomonas_salina.1